MYILPTNYLATLRNEILVHADIAMKLAMKRALIYFGVMSAHLK